MTVNILQTLMERGLLREDQFVKLEAIATRKVFSVFYELRTLLYLGVMLFTTGIGFLIYQNIGELGHILAIMAISFLSIACFIYCFWKASPFSLQKVGSPNPYFDYVLLLGSLLFVSVFGYLEFQYGFLEKYARVSSLLTAVFFFVVAYRFDHLGILSLAITSLASFFGLVVTINDLSTFERLYNVGLALATGLAILSIVLEQQKIKSHFTFTYLNFAAIIFFVSSIAGVSEGSGNYAPYLLATLAGSTLGIFAARKRKSFMFLLYSVGASYIATTIVIANNTNWDIEGWLFYLLASCGGFIYFIVKYRNYFKRTA